MISPTEYMSSPVITADADASVDSVSKLMDRHNIGSVVIIEKDHVVGIVTERDLVRKVLSKGVSPLEIPARDVMTQHVHTLGKEATLLDVSALMKKHTMRRIVVTDTGSPTGKPVGIITSRDIISLLVE